MPAFAAAGRPTDPQIANIIQGTTQIVLTAAARASRVSRGDSKYDLELRVRLITE